MLQSVILRGHYREALQEELKVLPQGNGKELLSNVEEAPYAFIVVCN